MVTKYLPNGCHGKQQEEIMEPKNKTKKDDRMSLSGQLEIGKWSTLGPEVVTNLVNLGQS